MTSVRAVINVPHDRQHVETLDGDRLRLRCPLTPESMAHAAARAGRLHLRLGGLLSGPVELDERIRTFSRQGIYEDVVLHAEASAEVQR